jgi:ribosomal protein S18 acetylase RimI-like enzyme
VIESLRLELLVPNEWEVLRAARLEALLDSPQAFMSSYEEESRWDESEWRRLFDAASWMVAREAEKVIGLAKFVIEPERPTARHVESAWVAPLHRQRGVFGGLLRRLAQIEGRMGVTDLLLWVLEDNQVAQLAYEALGFKPTGECQFLPALGRSERHLTLAIKCLLDTTEGARSQDTRQPA